MNQPAWSPEEPFNDLPPLSGTGQETRRVLKQVVEARSALAALDQAIRTLPNPDLLIGNLPLLEAQASSEVENIVTTTDDLFQYAASGSASAPRAAAETLRYRTALYRGNDLIKGRPLTTRTAIEVCSTLRGTEVKVRTLPGTYIGDPASPAATYTPPEGGDRIRKKLQEWEQFVNTDQDLDPLVRMALAHYQFEAIHPFTDGNGRTGRILNVLMLVSEGLLSQPVLYLSRYIIENKAEYYDRLLEVTRSGEWEEWVIFMLKAVTDTARRTLELIGGIQAAQVQYEAALKAVSPAGANSDFLATVFEQPYIRIADVVERVGVSRPTATRWLRDSVTAGLADEKSVGREIIFTNKLMLDALKES